MADVEIVAEGLQFPEGPVACADGSVLVVELRGQKISRVGRDGGVQTVARVDGAPNGLAVGPDGALYCCNNGGYAGWLERAGRYVPQGVAADYRNGWIDRIDPSTGRSERLYEACDGIPLAAPNDIVFDGTGGFWFTDNGKDLGTHERHGGLYYARADGSAITRIVFGLALNGVGLSPDGTSVYAADTPRRQIFAFSTQPKQASGPAAVPTAQGHGMNAGRIVASFPGRQLLDSLAIEADGTIAQARVLEEPGIVRVDPHTGAIRAVPMPDRLPTNIAFGGTDLRDAYVTFSAGGILAKLRWPDPGLPLAFAL